MSAITPTVYQRESMGSLTLHSAYFATATTDTWSSALPNSVMYWAVAHSGGGVGVSVLSASGQTSCVFTITMDVTGPVTLFSASRS